MTQPRAVQFCIGTFQKLRRQNLQLVTPELGLPGARAFTRHRPMPSVASGQIPSSRTKTRPSQTKKMDLDFLGFFRPIRDLSMGYRRQTGKILFLGPFGPARAASSAPIGGRAGLRAGWRRWNRATRRPPRDGGVRTDMEQTRNFGNTFLSRLGGRLDFRCNNKEKTRAWRDPSPIGRRWRGAPDEGRRAAAIVRQAASRGQPRLPPPSCPALTGRKKGGHDAGACAGHDGPSSSRRLSPSRDGPLLTPYAPPPLPRGSSPWASAALRGKGYG